MPLSHLRAHLLWSCMQVLNRDRCEALLKIFGTLAEAARHVDDRLLRELGCREQTVKSVLQRMEQCDPEEEEKLLVAAKAAIIAFGDPQYPERLGSIPDAPAFLYIQGDLSVLGHPSVALVGTRKMSPYGKRVTQEFTRALVHGGITTVSGLARGIDSLVASETLGLGGRTVAILGQGFATLSPRVRFLADQILEGGGLLVSEFPLRTEPDLFTFPLRNRIIAGLSLATVVLEAPEKSGALITAHLAFDYGRDVFAVPGQIFDVQYAGCHAIIRKNQARIAASPREIFQEIGVVVPDDDPERKSYVPQNDDEKKVLTGLTTMPQNVDELIGKTGMAVGILASTLTHLELNGIVKNIGAGQWVKT